MERFNEKEFDLELGKCWIFKDKHSDVYIHTLGGHIQRIPKYHAEALKKYFSEEKIPQSIIVKCNVCGKPTSYIVCADCCIKNMVKAQIGESQIEDASTYNTDYPEWCPGSEHCKTNNCDECEWEPIQVLRDGSTIEIKFKNETIKVYKIKESRFIAPNRLIETIGYQKSYLSQKGFHKALRSLNEEQNNKKEGG